MEEIMSGGATPAQIGAFLTALRLKGETVEEIVGFARTVRARATPLNVDGPVVDTAGTGGDGLHTFNISTAAALVGAGAGLKVAKHGGRAASSQCGSADVLEALGVRIDLGAERVKQCLQEVGIGFMFAPVFHPAFKHVAGPRRELGIRTVFNILGPLTNPAGAKAQLLGVADGSLVEKMALSLQSLGCHHALVVHGEDGLDEITISGETRVCEVTDGNVKSYSVTPGDFGLSRSNLNSLTGGTVETNASLLRSALAGAPGPMRDVVLMNAAALLLAGDKVKTLKQGVELAAKAIDSGQAIAKLEQLSKLSQSFPKES
jgi:anthranilate phosphoribosyltransferase